MKKQAWVKCLPDTFWHQMWDKQATPPQSYTSQLYCLGLYVDNVGALCGKVTKKGYWIYTGNYITLGE